MAFADRGAGGPGRRRSAFFSPGIPWGLFLFLLLVIIQGALIGFWMVASNSGAADLILTNALVRTMDPETPLAEAVAIQDGKILAVGNNQEVGAFSDADTRILDLDGGGKPLPLQRCPAGR